MSFGDIQHKLSGPIGGASDTKRKTAGTTENRYCRLSPYWRERGGQNVLNAKWGGAPEDLDF